jgi:predicted O-methyltransferase YrrM
MAPNRYFCLADEVKKIKPKTILEVGTHNGRSASIMLEEAVKHNADVKYFGFDLFEDMTEEIAVKEHHGKKLPSMSIASQKLAPYYATLFKGDTKETLAEFRPDEPVDFVFIDGGHSVETIESDWNNIKEVISDSSVVVFDDYYTERTDVGCKTLVDSLEEEGYDVQEIESGISFSKKRDLGQQIGVSMMKVTKK